MKEARKMKVKMMPFSSGKSSNLKYPREVHFIAILYQDGSRVNQHDPTHDLVYCPVSTVHHIICSIFGFLVKDIPILPTNKILKCDIDVQSL